MIITVSLEPITIKTKIDSDIDDMFLTFVSDKAA